MFVAFFISLRYSQLKIKHWNYECSCNLKIHIFYHVLVSFEVFNKINVGAGFGCLLECLCVSHLNNMLLYWINRTTLSIFSCCFSALLMLECVCIIIIYFILWSCVVKIILYWISTSSFLFFFFLFISATLVFNFSDYLLWKDKTWKQLLILLILWPQSWALLILLLLPDTHCNLWIV